MAIRKRAGRPAHTVPTRTGRVAFRVTESQERSAIEAAARDGVRLSDFARDALLKAVAKAAAKGRA